MRNRGRGRRGGRLLEATSGGVSYDPLVELSALHGWDASRDAGADASPFVSGPDLVTGANSRALSLFGIGGSIAPTIKANAQGGRKMWQFVAAAPSDAIQTALFASTIPQPYWFHGVMKIPAATSSRFYDGGSATPGTRSFAGQGVANYNFFAESTLITGGVTDANAHSYSMFFNGAASVLYRDNVAVASGNPGTAGLSFIVFGGRDNTGAFPTDCFFGEGWLAPSTAIAGAAPSAAELANAMNFRPLYSKPKWGLV